MVHGGSLALGSSILALISLLKTITEYFYVISNKIDSRKQELSYRHDLKQEQKENMIMAVQNTLMHASPYVWTASRDLSVT